MARIRRTPLRSPRKRYRQEDLDLPVSMWQHIRTRGAEEACLKFTGMPVFIVDQLAELARPLLPQYDKSLQRRGQPTKLDHVDVIAVALRYTQLVDKKYMEHLSIGFARNDAVLQRAVRDGMEALRAVLKTLPDAAIRYPTLAEATKQWVGMKTQLGEPAWKYNETMCVLFTDGTFTPAAACA